MYWLYDDKVLIVFFCISVLRRCSNDLEINYQWTSPLKIAFHHSLYDKLEWYNAFKLKPFSFQRKFIGTYLPSSKGRARSSSLPFSLLLDPTITIARSSSSVCPEGGGPPISLGTLDSPNCPSEASLATGNRNPASSAADVSTGKKFLPVPSTSRLLSPLA